MTNAGGIAARRGFKYQDQIAVGFLLDMLLDPALMQVECEIDDDIVLVWTDDLVEYVQVKSEEGRVWSTASLFGEADDGAASIADKSLARDKRAGSARFRLVTRRGVHVTLEILLLEHDNREHRAEEIVELAEKLSRKRSRYRSPRGRSFADWVRALYIQRDVDSATLKVRLEMRILQMFEQVGLTPSALHAERIYKALLDLAIDAAEAPADQPGAKSFKRADLLDWWNRCIDEVRSQQRSSMLVYQVPTPEFFSEFHLIDEQEIGRALRGYDAEFDGTKWRCDELAEHLLDWLPELALQSRELEQFTHLSGRRKLRVAAQRFEAYRHIDDRTLVASLLQHAILRHHLQSEPVPCRLFYPTSGQVEVTGAHLVQHSKGDQLWLGRARLSEQTAIEQTIGAVCEDLAALLERAILIQQRDLIVQLREPQHMRPTTLEKALAPNGKLSDLIDALHISVLLAYDSEVIRSGFTPAYVSALREEADAVYNSTKVKLGGAARALRVHVFAVPIECVNTLSATFGMLLRGAS